MRSYRAVEDADVASERVFAFAEYEWYTTHVFSAADQEYVTLTSGDHLRRVRERAQPARAISFQHGARYLDWKIGRKASMARNTTAVRAGLIGAANDNVLDLLGLECGLRHDGPDCSGEQIIGADLGKRAGTMSERSAQPFVDISV